MAEYAGGHVGITSVCHEQGTDVLLATFLQNEEWMEQMYEQDPFAFDDMLDRTLAGLKSENFDPKEIVVNLTSSGIWGRVKAKELCEYIGKSKSPSKLKQHTLHLIFTNRIQPETEIESSNSLLVLLLTNISCEKLFQTLNTFVSNESEKTLSAILDEIKKCDGISSEMCKNVRDIVQKDRHYVDSTFDYNRQKVTQYSRRRLKYNSSRRDNEYKHVDSFSNVKLLLKNPSENLSGLARLLSELCNAVYETQKYRPRVTQKVSWCLFVLSEGKGQLLEVKTGEGKSCIVAMLAATLALSMKKVDVLTSSSVLAKRDAREWEPFYSRFDITVDHNDYGMDDEESLKRCYECSVVYGTVHDFTGDVLRQEFSYNHLRGTRGFDVAIVDEVDMLLIDECINCTYLSSNAIGMHHLEPVLSVIWGTISQYNAAFTPDGKQFIVCRPQAFYETVFQSLNVELSNRGIILDMAASTGTISSCLREFIINNDLERCKQGLNSVNIEGVLTFLTVLNVFIEQQGNVGCTFRPYVLKGNLIVQADETFKGSTPILVLDSGYCCYLYEDIEFVKIALYEKIKLQLNMNSNSNSKDKIDVPQFLSLYVNKRLLVWIEKAFDAIQMQEGREYVLKDGEVVPIDYASTGVTQESTHWSDGLHQFLEMKHCLKVKHMSECTNFMSYYTFLRRYDGRIFGASGTLGSECDQTFVKQHFKLKLCHLPTAKTCKLFEYVPLIANGIGEWHIEIIKSLQANLSKTEFSLGRAALVICEDVNTAKQLKAAIKTQVSCAKHVELYTRSDREDEIHAIGRIFRPGDVLVATNLAGRGTDIKVSNDVNASGGLFVLLTFLAKNDRVERQAFGRSARQGNCGSAQIIVNSKTLDEYHQSNHGKMHLIKTIRTKVEERRLFHLETSWFAYIRLRDELFQSYCKLKTDVHEAPHRNEISRDAAVKSLNEYFALWLSENKEGITLDNESRILEKFSTDFTRAKQRVISGVCPFENWYHKVFEGNTFLLHDETRNHARSRQCYDEAIRMSPDWSTVAYYYKALSLIQENSSSNYIDSAMKNLEKCRDTLPATVAQQQLCLQLNQFSGSHNQSAANDFRKQISARIELTKAYENNIQQIMTKLSEAQSKGGKPEAALVKLSELTKTADDFIKQELSYLHNQGLVALYSVDVKPQFSWEGLLVAVFGVIEIAVGTVLCVTTVGVWSAAGAWMVVEGIQDVIKGCKAMWKGEHFSIKDWVVSKMCSVLTSVATYGVIQLAPKILNALKLPTDWFSEFTRGAFAEVDAVKDVLTGTKKLSAKAVTAFASREIARCGINKGLELAGSLVTDKLMEKAKAKIKDVVRGLIDRWMDNRIGVMFCHLVAQALSKTEFFLVHSQMSFQNVKEIITNVVQQIGETVINFFKEIFSSVIQPIIDEFKGNGKIYPALKAFIECFKGDFQDGTAKKIFTIAVQACNVGKTVYDTTKVLHDIVTKLGDAVEQTFKERFSQVNTPPGLKYNELKGVFQRPMANIKEDISEQISETLISVLRDKVANKLVSSVQGEVSGAFSKTLSCDILEQHTQLKHCLNKGAAILKDKLDNI